MRRKIFLPHPGVKKKPALTFFSINEPYSLTFFSGSGFTVFVVGLSSSSSDEDDDDDEEDDDDDSLV